MQECRKSTCLLRYCPKVLPFVRSSPIARFLVVNNQDYAMLCNRPPVHLAASMGAVNHLRADLNPYLALIDVSRPFSAVLVKDYLSLTTVDRHCGGPLSNHKPLFQIPFTSIQMSLIFRPEPFFLPLEPDLPAGNPLGKPLQDLDDPDVDQAWLAHVCPNLFVRLIHRDSF